jgi:hypothetical protein
MRPVAIGSKNWIHVGSEQAGPRVAAIISIVETCRRLQIPVRGYLSAVLPGLENFPAKSGKRTNADGVSRPEVANHQNPGPAPILPTMWLVRRNRSTSGGPALPRFLLRQALLQGRNQIDNIAAACRLGRRGLALGGSFAAQVAGRRPI